MPGECSAHKLSHGLLCCLRFWGPVGLSGHCRRQLWRREFLELTRGFSAEILKHDM